MNQQLDLFTFNTPKYVINKPIKLIELFAGIGSQHKAFKILGANVENHKICEWAYGIPKGKCAKMYGSNH